MKISNFRAGENTFHQAAWRLARFSGWRWLQRHLVFQPHLVHVSSLLQRNLKPSWMCPTWALQAPLQLTRPAHSSARYQNQNFQEYSSTGEWTPVLVRVRVCWFVLSCASWIYCASCTSRVSFSHITTSPCAHVFVFCCFLTILPCFTMMIIPQGCALQMQWPFSRFLFSCFIGGGCVAVDVLSSSAKLPPRIKVEIIVWCDS